MISYSAIIKDSSPYFFYRSDGSVLFEVNRRYSFPGYLFTIKIPHKLIVLKCEIRKLFATRIKILHHDFDKLVSLERDKKRYKLSVEDDIVCINEKFKILGKYEASIVVNEKEIGFIKEEKIFPYKKYIITFNTDDDINFYAIVLFAIISAYFADGI